MSRLIQWSVLAFAVAMVLVALGVRWQRRAPGTTPLARFAVGDRVRVAEPGFWADGAIGSIAVPPSAIVELGDGWQGHVRMVETTTGARPFYWVRLDEPRRDADGDGPYGEAEIAEQSLRPLETMPPP